MWKSRLGRGSQYQLVLLADTPFSWCENLLSWYLAIRKGSRLR